MKSKKWVSWLLAILIFVLCLPNVATAKQEKVKLYHNGEWSSWNSALFYGDRTLFSVRALEEKMKYQLTWIADEQKVVIEHDDTRIEWIMDSFSYTLNGETKTSDVPAKLMEGKVYLPVRLVAEGFGYTVRWNEQLREVYLIPPTTHPENLDTLVELGFVTEKDLQRTDFLTNQEVVAMLHNGYITEEQYSELATWYSLDYFELWDHLEDSLKLQILDLHQYHRNMLLAGCDVEVIDWDQNLTWYQALNYLTRIIAHTYGCSDLPIEIEQAGRETVYLSAYQRGLIDSLDMSNADTPIPRQTFYRLLNQTLYIPYSQGGYSTRMVRAADEIRSSLEFLENVQNTSQPEPVTRTVTYRVKPEITVEDNLSIQWELPSKYQYLVDERHALEVVFYNNRKESVTEYFWSVKQESQITGEEMLQCLLPVSSQQVSYLVCTYQERNTDNRYTFRVDLPEIVFETKGEALQPGVYLQKLNQWKPKAITLADGASFQEDCYYILHSKEHTYRLDQYNHTALSVFWMEQEALLAEDVELYGYVYTDEIHLSSAKIIKSSSGFTISFTPVSTQVFTVQ